MSNLGDRIKLARTSLEPAEMKQRILADRLNVQQGRLSNWERGQHEPPHNKLEEIADILQVRLGWLETGLGPMREPLRTGWRTIPVRGAITAGLPGASIADLDYMDVRDWQGALERWGRTIEGHSMLSEHGQPDDLFPGDIAIFEDRPAEYGHVVQAEREGEDTVKVLRKVALGIELWPLNPYYEPFSAEGWQVKGVLVSRIRKREYGIVETVDYPHGLRPRM